MDRTSLARLAGLRTLPSQGRYSGRTRTWWVGAFVLLALAFQPPAAWTQSCAGKVAGDVCRPAAGPCDVAETCVAPASPPAPMFQPTDGTVYTDVGWYYNMGYA